MMNLILRFFEQRATPQVENAAIAVSHQRATFHEDPDGNKTAVFESMTWSGNETAGPLMFQHNAPRQQQQLAPVQHNNPRHQQAQRYALPYQQQPIVQENQRRLVPMNRWISPADDEF